MKYKSLQPFVPSGKDFALACRFLRAPLLLLFVLFAAGISSALPALANTLNMSGSIDNRMGINMVLYVADNKVTGTYGYGKANSGLNLDGTVSGGVLKLNEKDNKGKVTGSFSGTLVPGKRIYGTWADAAKSKSLPFIAAVADASSLDGGKDGIIITHQTKKYTKTKDVTNQEPAVITYPVVDQSRIASVGAKVQALLSTKNVLKQSPEEMGAEVKKGDGWLNEVDYTVNYNKNYLVDMDFSQDGCGAYPDGSVSHVLVDLKSGQQVKAKSAFNAASLAKLKGMIKQKMIAEAKSSVAEMKDQPDDLEALKSQFPSPIEPKSEDLDNFTVSDKGLTFTHDWGFPHVCQALEPEGKYFFAYKELASIINPAGPLGQFVGK